MNNVQIVLPTYNGEKYLAFLMDSLAAQTYKDFTLITYDDGSSDRSVQIVDSYKNSIQIVRIDNESNQNRGVIESFVHLLSNCDSENVMLCDQDDIWDCNKVAFSMEKLNKMRGDYGDIPLLVFTDLEMIDEKGNKICDSFLRFHSLNPNNLNDPYYLCFKNVAPGCSYIFNKKLIKESFPVGDKAVMHDWWMVIAAGLKGKISFLDEKLIKYRVHSSNTMGPVADNPLPVILSILSMFSLKKVNKIIMSQHKNTDQGRQIFRKFDRRFFVTLYYLKLFLGRYVFPTLAIVNRWCKIHSWR